MTRVGIVYPRANLDTVPSLIGAAEALAARGHQVDIFSYSAAGQAPPRFSSDRVSLHSLGTDAIADQSTARLRGMVRQAKWLPGAARIPLARGYAALGAGLTHGSRLLARARGSQRQEPFSCVIGVDPDGLILANSIARGAPVAYYSLELLLSYELTTPAERQLKEQERALVQRAPFIIIQDADRARLLADDNAIEGDRLLLVPNAPGGPARRAPRKLWHSRLSLPDDARVVLHAGSLGDWTGIEDLVHAVPDWPEPWVLVVHTRYDAESSSYVERLRAHADSRRVFFSLKAVDRHMYDDLVDSADVGLAFYVASAESAFTQRNVQTIGLSSGKLAYYLRAGLPAIVNRAASIAESLQAAGCAVAVENASGVSGALLMIAADYTSFSTRACEFFDNHLDFARGFQAVIERIEALAVTA